MIIIIFININLFIYNFNAISPTVSQSSHFSLSFLNLPKYVAFLKAHSQALHDCIYVALNKDTWMY